jgi:predicted transcriptional regulator/DNA-binding XRE family transcriptional regulator
MALTCCYAGTVSILLKLACELVTNAVLACAGLRPKAPPLVVWLGSDTSYVLAGVADASPRTPVLLNLGIDAEGGRGLALVEAFSTRWGWHPTATASLVKWCGRNGACHPGLVRSRGLQGRPAPVQSDRPGRISPLGLGSLETAIMRVVWEADSWLTVRAIRERMDYTTVGHTTVARVAGILHEKGLLVRRLGDREGKPGPLAWWYRAARPEHEHIGELIAALLDYSSDPRAALRYALAERRKRSPERPQMKRRVNTASSSRLRRDGFYLTVVDGRRLRQLRLQRQLTQLDLADCSGISIATISKVESRPGTRCRDSTIAALATAVGAPAASLRHATDPAYAGFKPLTLQATKNETIRR